MINIDGRIVGTWRLVGTMGKDDQGKLLPPPYGPQALGLVIFNANGRMMAVLNDGRAEMPAGETRAYVSYAGTYTFDGTTLVTRVDVSSDPTRIGTDQVRRVRFEGERLVLMPPPRLWRGVMQHRELFWEKVG